MRARPGRRLAFGMFAAAVIGFAAVFWLRWERSRIASVPRIATAGLSETSGALLRQHLEQVHATPRSGTAWGRLGTLLRSFELLAEARRCLAEAERLEPREPRWPYLHGLALVVEFPSEALVKLHRAAQLCGTQPDAPRLRLAKLLAEAGRWDAVEQELQPLLRLDPAHGPALLLLAQAAQARGNGSLAIDLALRSVRDPRTARGGWASLAMSYQRQGDADAARQAGEKAASLPPDPLPPDPFETEAALLGGRTRPLSDRAQQLLAGRRLSEATPLIQRLVREHPEFAEGWLLLGRLQLLQGQPDAGEHAILRHLQLEPQSAAGLFQLGLAELNQRRSADAAGAFQRAVELKRDFGPAHFNLGVALARSGRKPEAVASFREAIRHSPEYFDSYLLLGNLLLELGRKEEASKLARQAEVLNPTDRRLPALKEKLAGR